MKRKSDAQRSKGRKTAGKVEKMNTAVKDRQTEIDENLDFFTKELPKISSSHLGKVALIRHKSIIGYFDTVVDAVGTGNKLYSDKLFSIQQVTDVPIDLGFFSHASRLGKSQ
jgi:hypothetical protein